MTNETKTTIAETTETTTFNPKKLYTRISFDVEYVGDAEPDFFGDGWFGMKYNNSLINGRTLISEFYEENSDDEKNRDVSLKYLTEIFDNDEVSTDSERCCLEIAVNANYFGNESEQELALENLRNFANDFWYALRRINHLSDEYNSDDRKQYFVQKIGNNFVFRWHGTKNRVKFWAIIELTKVISHLAHKKWDLCSFENFDQMCETYKCGDMSFYKRVMGYVLYL